MIARNELYAKCRRELAGYKQPKDIRFVAFAELPRSTTAKIQCHEVEAWLGREEAIDDRSPSGTNRAGRITASLRHPIRCLLNLLLSSLSEQSAYFKKSSLCFSSRLQI